MGVDLDAMEKELGEGEEFTGYEPASFRVTEIGTGGQETLLGFFSMTEQDLSELSTPVVLLITVVVL